MKHIQLRTLLKETIVENHQPKEQVDEVIVSLVAGAVAAIPGILKGLGWIAKKAGKWIGSEKLQSIGETGSELGDKLHNKYIGWVQKLLWPFSVDNHISAGFHLSSCMRLNSGLFLSFSFILVNKS